MTDVESFLAKQQRFECARLAANLTVEQCDANRKRVGFQQIFACVDCAGLGMAVEMQARTKSKPYHIETVEIRGKAMATIKLCPGCNEVKKIHSYGHCAKCLYKKYGKTMKPPKGEASPPSPQVVKQLADSPDLPSSLSQQPAGPAKSPLLQLLKSPATLSMTLDFTNDPDIYRQLIEKEIDEEQVIGLLSMLLDGELQRVA